MRIVALIYDDIDNPWLGGGGARRTYEVARRLTARHDLTIVAGGYPSAPAQRTRDGVRYLFTAPQTSYAASRLAYMRGAPLLARKLKCDLTIEVFSAYNPLFSPLWAKGTILAILHNIYSGHAAAKHGLLGKLAGLLEQPALSRFPNYLAVSHGLADQLAHTVRLRGKRLAVIPNGIDSAFFAAPHSSGQSPYVLFLGRIDIYQKGLDTLLAALHRANMPPTEGERIRLIIAGGGPEEQVSRVCDLIAGYGLGDDVEMRGRVSTTQAADLLLDNACHFVVMPSRHESYPLVAAEAGAAGKALLAFDISGLREAAPATAHGLLLPPLYPPHRGGEVNNPPNWRGGINRGAEGWGEGDEEQRIATLSAALTALWHDPELAAQLGQRGRSWAQRFTWDAIANAEERYYLSLVGMSR